MIDRDILNTLPYLVIEELKPNSPVSGVFSVADNVPISFSRIRYITRVHAVRFSQRGCYLGRKAWKKSSRVLAVIVGCWLEHPQAAPSMFWLFGSLFE